MQTKREETLGLFLGFIGVVIFAATLPMTRLGVGSLSPTFMTSARAAIAGVIALVVLLAFRRPVPGRQMPRLLVAALCLVAGFPGFSSFAMVTLPGAHAGVVNGLLPLATAVVSALIAGERPSASFWLCAVAGAALVAAFALRHGGGALQGGDALQLAAVAVAALGYTLSGQLAREIPSWEVISWMVVLCLPLSAPLAYFSRPADPAAIPALAWMSLAYLGIMSMYLGFFAWNAGMALGGVARVSQVQLAQPFVTIGLSALLLGEQVDFETIVFAALVVALVFVGRKQRIAAVPALSPARPSA